MSEIKLDDRGELKALAASKDLAVFTADLDWAQSIQDRTLETAAKLLASRPDGESLHRFTAANFVRSLKNKPMDYEKARKTKGVVAALRVVIGEVNDLSLPITLNHTKLLNMLADYEKQILDAGGEL